VDAFALGILIRVQAHRSAADLLEGKRRRQRPGREGATADCALRRGASEGDGGARLYSGARFGWWSFVGVMPSDRERGPRAGRVRWTGEVSTCATA